MDGFEVHKLKVLEGQLQPFRNYKVGEILEGSIKSWSGDKCAFRPKQAEEVENMGLQVWSNGNFQNYCENSRAYVLEGKIGQGVVAKINGIWQRAEILRVDSPVDLYVEGKETLERKLVLMTQVKKLTQEIAMIKLATIKCKLKGCSVKEEDREKFRVWRSSVIGEVTVEIVEVEKEAYKINLFQKGILQNIIVTMELGY